MGKECGRVKRRKERVTAPITLPRLDPATLAELRHWYENTPNVESRTRYQMVLLAQQDYKVSQIACLVPRSEDTVARVLNRFEAGKTGCRAPAQPARPKVAGHGSVGYRIAARH